MLLNILNIDSLEVIKDDFVDFKNELIDEYNNGFLYEDMFLAKSYLKNILLDIGWVTLNDSFENGYFKILIVENTDWDSPLLYLKANKKDDFIKKLELALIFLKKYENI